ncbi:hypothetical protein [Bosea vaviloviae]|uniref:hypothetical protein n=1 Tax=Bosea vaviloviae TaxID=1526658 RepID=UPI0011DF6F6D|nr:hypothetical protein [Bosea vaviloviae]
MTIQANDRFNEGQKVYPVITPALDPLLDAHLIDARDFCDTWMTSCWRGYIASWRIVDGELLLWKLRVPSGLQWIDAPKELKAEVLALSGSSKFPVFANWFTGDFIIGLGERYPSGFAFGLYEIERIFTIKNGLVHRERRKRRIARSWIDMARR